MTDSPIDRRTVLAFLGGAMTGGYFTSMYSLSKFDGSPAQPTPTNPNETTPEQTPEPTETPNRAVQPPELENRPYLGDPRAPVTLVYWGDNQCPFCQRFEEQTLPQLREDFLDTGDAVLYFKPLSIFGEDSQRAALATHSVWEQTGGNPDTFWAWYSELSNMYNGTRNSGWASLDELAALARETDGVNAEVLRENVSNEEYRSRIMTDLRESQQDFDMQGTPHFIVYGDDFEEYQTIRGAQPYSLFESTLSDIE